MSATWADVGLVLTRSWPGLVASWGEAGIQGYLDELAARGVTPPHAVAALRASTSEFPPPAGKVAAAGPSPCSPNEALVLLQEAARRVGRSIYAEDFHDRHQAAVDWLAERDPVLAAYAARRGLCGPGSFGAEEIHSDHGGAVRHRLVGEIRDAYRHADERAARGLPVVEPGMLLVRDTGAKTGGMAELVDRLRPARQIGA